MYLWKVWFRVRDPLPGLPWIQEVQSHNFRKSGSFVGNQAASTDWLVLHVLSGVFHLRVGEELRALMPGDTAVLARSASWRRELLADAPATTFVYATLKGDGLAAQLTALTARSGWIRRLPCDSGPIHRLIAFRSLYQRYARANPERRSDTPRFPLPATEAFLLAADLIAALAAEPAPADAPLAQAAALVERIRHLVRESGRFDFQVAELAKAMGCSRKHVHWAFRTAGSSAPQDWLHEQRMREAARLLAAGESVGRVAKTLGFSTASNFSRAFRRETGRSPLEAQRSTAG